MTRIISFLLLCAAAGASTGFVYLSKNSAKLPATPESPVVTFVWDGVAPHFTGIAEFENGKYTDMSDADITKDILQRAFSRWNSVQGSYLILRLAEGATVIDENDKTNSFAVSDKVCERGLGTTPHFSADKKTIDDCDVSVCVKSVDVSWFIVEATHETGHCLGLGHPDSTYGALMSYANNGGVRNLTSDDMAGIVSLYPDPAYGDTKVKNVVKCGVVGGKGGSRVGFLAAMLLPLLVVGLMTVAMRSRSARLNVCGHNERRSNQKTFA